MANSIVANTFGSSNAVQDIAQFEGVHAERDLHQWERKQPWSQLVPEPFEYDVSYLRSDGVGTYKSKHCALLPHEMFHTLFLNAPEVFHYLFVGGAGNLAAWWGHTQDTDPDFVRDHPGCLETAPEFRVPIGMHGDDAGLFEHEKVLVFSWNSVAVERSTIDNRILFGTLAYSKIIPGLTLYEFYDVFVWSLNALSYGRFPSVDHKGKKFDESYYPWRAAMAGQALAGDFVGLWSEFRGELIQCMRTG